MPVYGYISEMPLAGASTQFGMRREQDPREDVLWYVLRTLA